MIVLNAYINSRGPEPMTREPIALVTSTFARMKKIELTDKAKLYLKMISEEKEIIIQNKERTNHLALLEEKGLIENNPTKDDAPYMYGNMEITRKGRAYLATNPKLENPSILDDKEFLFDGALTLFAMFK